MSMPGVKMPKHWFGGKVINDKYKIGFFLLVGLLIGFIIGGSFYHYVIIAPRLKAAVMFGGIEINHIQYNLQEKP